MSLTQILFAGVLAASSASAVDVQVQASGGNATFGHHYGLLHEDISYSGDGGLYAELIRNRAFQFSPAYPASLDFWSAVGGAELSLQNLTEPLSGALPTSMNVAVGDGAAAGAEEVGFANVGFFGIDVQAQTYTGSFWVRGAYEGSFTASLRSTESGEVLGSVEVPSAATADAWTEHAFALVPDSAAADTNNSFVVTFDAGAATSGSLDFNLISLFPPTYKDRENGMRVDLAEAIAGFHPKLFRIPGGNMLEGLTITTWWDWKNSIGPLKDRPGFQGVWDYQQTNGLGLLEYLLFAEDLGMELIVGVWAGHSLSGEITPEEELQPFIDDALREIEFIAGPADTEWGAVRAGLGHPEPFALRYVEVGNEEYLTGGWDSYKAYRFTRFLEAIGAAYPDIQVVCAGSVYDGYDIPEPAFGDYHVYGSPDALVDQFDLFDNVATPHVIGEVAATFQNGNEGDFEGGLALYPWWAGSVGEAVTLLGSERNSDRILGALYAPIVRSLVEWQWATTMMQFSADPAQTTRGTSWYVWELLAANEITETLPTNSEFDPLYYVAGKNSETGSLVFKAAVYNSTDGAEVPVTVAFEGVEAGSVADLTVLTGPEDSSAFNDPQTGVNVVQTSQSTVTADEQGVFSFSLPNLSVAVLSASS